MSSGQATTQIRVMHPDATGIRGARGDTCRFEGETGSRGELRLSRVPPGRYAVRLGGGAWREVEVRAGEVTRVELVRE